MFTCTPIEQALQLGSSKYRPPLILGKQITGGWGDGGGALTPRVHKLLYTGGGRLLQANNLIGLCSNLYSNLLGLSTQGRFLGVNGYFTPPSA